MDVLTRQALVWSLLVVFPLYFLGCAIWGVRQKELSKWLLYGVAGGVVLMFPSVAVFKGILKSENTHQGVVAEAESWNREWAPLPEGAADVHFFEEPGFAYFSCEVERDAFVAWAEKLGLATAERDQWATLHQPSLVKFQNRGVDLQSRKLHYRGPQTVALFLVDDGMMYFQTKAL